jgi:hypothetical protein
MAQASAPSISPFSRYAVYPISHSSTRGVLYTKIMVLSLAFAIKDSAKLSACFGMLEYSFLGCKSGFRLHTENWFPALEKEDIYTGIVGGGPLNRTNHTK